MRSVLNDNFHEVRKGFIFLRFLFFVMSELKYSRVQFKANSLGLAGNSYCFGWGGVCTKSTNIYFKNHNCKYFLLLNKLFTDVLLCLRILYILRKCV